MRLVLLSVALLVGCGPEEPAEIVSFAVEPSEVEAGAEVTTTVDVEHFEFAGHGSGMMDETDDMPHGDGMDDDRGEMRGHVHIYLDDLETNPLLMQGTRTASVMIPVDTEPGEHTMFARCHREDHRIVEPEVIAEATITVLAPD